MKKICLIIVGIVYCTIGYAQYKELRIVSKDRKYGFADTTGKIVIPLDYDYVGEFSEGLAYVELNDKLGFIDENGNVAIPIIYDNGGKGLAFTEGLARVWLKGKKGGKYGFIDKSGKEVIKIKYYGAGFFSEGLAWVQLNNSEEFGYINKAGKVVIPFIYQSAGEFSEGLALVGRGKGLQERYGYIDAKGKVVIPFIYNTASGFSSGIAWVSQNERFGYIDKNGNEFLKYDGIKWNNTHTQAEVWKDGKHGNIDATGNEITPLEFKDLVMQFVWEKTDIMKIEDYYRQLNKNATSSGFFKVKQPYLVVSRSGDEYKMPEGSNVIYSLYEKSISDFNEQTMDDIKTLIIKKDFEDKGARYQNESTPPPSPTTAHLPYERNTGVTVTSYGTYLIYYDMEKRECVGHDVIRGQILPFRTTSTRLYNSKDKIIEKIESHFNPEQ